MIEKNNMGPNRLPQHFRTFVEIFFAVVLGGSILELNAFLFPPNLHSPNFWALVAVYFTAVTSWIGWHKSTTNYPYTDSVAGHLRSVLDGIIVVTYAALLFFSSGVEKSFYNIYGLDNSLCWYLWGFVIVFLLYFIVGEIRRIEYNRGASEIYLIIRHGVFLLVIAIAYTILYIWLPSVLNQLPTSVLWIFVFLPLITMISFRSFREWRYLSWRTQRLDKINIAVDMDGVLVEQVAPVLEKINCERGLRLIKADITDWEYPIDDTNIKIEIEKAEQEEGFVSQMPIMEGAKEALDILCKNFNIIIATSRESNTDPWSTKWLKSHGIKYKQLINTRSEGKVLTDADILIDDYIGNIKVFLENKPSSRQAILFAQPWNSDISSVSDFIAMGRIKIAHSWSSILAIFGCAASPKRIQP
jgi:5'(3')-deoxyribonucleotidase